MSALRSETALRGRRQQMSRAVDAVDVRRRLVAGVPMLAAVVLSAALNTRTLSQNGYANVSYSAGVKSMLLSLAWMFAVDVTPASQRP